MALETLRSAPSSDEFMEKPGKSFDPLDSSKSDSTDSKVDRLVQPYRPCFGRYVIRERKFERQYNHIYVRRVRALRPYLMKAAKRIAAAQPGKSEARILDRVIDLRQGQERVVVGTVYKEQAKKPSALDEFSADGVTPVTDGKQDGSSFCSEDDSLILEDTSGRISLESEGAGGLSLPVDAVVTGMGAAVRGTVNAAGALVVSAIAFSGLSLPPAVSSLSPAAGTGAAPSSSSSSSSSSAASSSASSSGGSGASAAGGAGAGRGSVLLVSDLGFGDGACDPLPRQMLLEFIMGCLGPPGAIAGAAKICRVIVAGNMVREDEDASLVAKALSLAEQQRLALPMQEADLWLSQVAASCPVDIVPGQDDLTNLTMPQQPLMPVNLPRTLRYASKGMVVLASNPHECEIGRVRLLGHGGQPVDDICRFTTARGLLPATLAASGGAPAGGGSGSAPMTDDGADVPPASSGAGSSSASTSSSTGASEGVREFGAGEGLSRARVLANTCMWRHLAPTAPDTLASYPFSQTDPFVMESEDAETQPHVVFAGSQPGFGAVEVSGAAPQVPDGALGHGDASRKSLFVSVPSFRRTGEAVLVDLDSLECSPLRFGLSKSMVSARVEAVAKAREEGKQAAADRAAAAGEVAGFKLKSASSGPSKISFQAAASSGDGSGAASGSKAMEGDEDEDEDESHTNAMDMGSAGMDDDEM